MSGIQWAVLVGTSIPVVAVCTMAHLESVGRHRRAINLVLEYDEGELES